MDLDINQSILIITAAGGMLGTAYGYVKKTVGDKRTRFLMRLGFELTEVYEDGNLTDEEFARLLTMFKKHMDDLKTSVHMED